MTRKRGRLKPVWSGSVADHVIDLGWSADGSFLAVAASTGPVTLFDAKAGTGDVSLVGHENGTLALAWSPTQMIVATAGMDRSVRLWDTTGCEIKRLEAVAEWVERLTWHADGSKLAASAGKAVHIWTNRGEELHHLASHPSTVSDLAWKPGTDTLSVLIYGGVMNWTLPTAGVPTSELFPWKGSPLRMAWSPDASMLAHGNQDSTVHFWYAATAEELQMWGYNTKVRELSWNATSRYLATGGGSSVCIWDCIGTGPAGSKPIILDEHAEDATLTCVVFQQHGELLASGGTDGRVCLWQPQNKQQPLLGVVDQGEEVTAIRWSPDDKLLAIGFASGTVSIVAIT